MCPLSNEKQSHPLSTFSVFAFNLSLNVSIPNDFKIRPTRSCRATVSWRAVDVGECRHVLQKMQRKQGESAPIEAPSCGYGPAEQTNMSTLFELAAKAHKFRRGRRSLRCPSRPSSVWWCWWCDCDDGGVSLCLTKEFGPGNHSSLVINECHLLVWEMRRGVHWRICE